MVYQNQWKVYVVQWELKNRIITIISEIRDLRQDKSNIVIFNCVLVITIYSRDNIHNNQIRSCCQMNYYSTSTQFHYSMHLLSQSSCTLWASPAGTIPSSQRTHTRGWRGAVWSKQCTISQLEAARPTWNLDLSPGSAPGSVTSQLFVCATC